MTSYPVVDEGEQKQDVLYCDNVNSGVIMEENTLRRNARSSDQKNATLSSFLSLLPAHARVARQSHPCVVGKTGNFVPCEGGPLTEVSCRTASFGCSYKQGTCGEIYTTCTTTKGKLKTFVTGCKCL